MSHNKILTYFPAALAIALGVEMLIPSAMAEILYDKEGIQLQGSARIVSRNAATCNVLEEKYSPKEYEELKGNQDQPLHVWRLDFSAHNNTGKTLGFLQANFDIRAPQSPCTNWSGEGPGGGPAGNFTDGKGNPGFVEPAGVSFKGLSRVSGMGVGEVARDTMFMLVFHRHEPVFKRWSVNFNFARAGETVVFDGMEFVGIAPGEFLMGSASRHADDNEQPVTRVRITKGFYLGKYEVTQAEWQAVMGNNPSRFSGCGSCPVERVSWDGVQAFIGKLNGMSAGGRYRLPTEEEWEYAARAGTTTDTYAGDITEPWGNDPVLNGIAWYAENCSGRTHPVGRKAPNGWGLYDMLGNVWEWVGDWYGAYPGGGVTDPAGPGSGSRRVFRGGGWAYGARSCRSAIRFRLSPGSRFDYLGFRLLREE